MKTKAPQSLASWLQGSLPAPVASRLPGRRLLSAWPKVAGELIAARVRPICLEPGNRLVLAAPGSVWRQELSLRAPEFVAKFRAAGLEIDDIKVVELRTPAPEQPKPPLPPLGPEDEEVVREIVGGVDDPELRRSLEGAIRAQIRARKAGDI